MYKSPSSDASSVVLPLPTILITVKYADNITNATTYTTKQILLHIFDIINNFPLGFCHR